MPVANATARDHRLSWRARGLLLELLSYPDGWDTTVDKIVAKARQQGDATEGRQAMRNAVGELAKFRYVQYIREADKHGHWTTVMSVSDAPQPEQPDRRTRNRTVGEPDRRETETSADRTSEDRSITKNTDTNTVTNTGDQRLSDEDSTSLASLAAAADTAADDERRERQLNRIYEVIDAMDSDLRRRHLLAVERKRPKIYRECRNEAIKQIEHRDPDELKGEQSALIIDLLSYKWMVKHYAPNWPQWFTRPLDEAVRAMNRENAA